MATTARGRGLRNAIPGVVSVKSDAATRQREDPGTGVRIDAQKRSGASELEDMLAESMRLHGLPTPEREFRFHEHRKFRLDFAWPALRWAVEIEGGIYRGGGHTHVKDLKRDMVKGNLLAMGGWRLLRFHGDQVRSGEAVATIKQALSDSSAAHDGAAGAG